MVLEKYSGFFGKDAVIPVLENSNFVYVWNLTKSLELPKSTPNQNYLLEEYTKNNSSLKRSRVFNLGMWIPSTRGKMSTSDKNDYFHMSGVFGKYALVLKFKVGSKGLESFGESFVEELIPISKDFDKKNPTPPSILDLQRWDFHSNF